MGRKLGEREALHDAARNLSLEALAWSFSVRWSGSPSAEWFDLRTAYSAMPCGESPVAPSSIAWLSRSALWPARKLAGHESLSSAYSERV